MPSRSAEVPHAAVALLVGTSVVLGLALVPRVAGAEGAVLGYGRIKSSLVEIYTFDSRQQPVSSGTGVVVASNATTSWVLTAQHVVERAVTVKVDVNRELHDIPCKVVQRGGRDLALLQVQHGGMKPASLSPRSPPVGEDVAVVAFPGETDRFTAGVRLTLGPISNYEYGGEVIDVSDADIEKGMSGGALIDPTNGDVFGIIDAKRTNAPGGYAISAPAAVFSFLKANAIAYALGSATAPATAAPEGIAKAVAGNVDQNAMQQAFFAENYSTAAALSGDYLIRHPDDNLANGVMVSTIRALFLTKNESQAVAAAKQYLVTHPRDTMANVVVASGMRTTFPEEATQRFAGMESVPYEFRPYVVEAYYHAAQKRVQSGDTEGAVARLRTALQYGTSPEVRQLLNSLAPNSVGTLPSGKAPQKSLQEFNDHVVQQLGDGHRDEAGALALQAHELYPTDGNIPFAVYTSDNNYAKSLESVGKWRTAIDELEHDAKLMEPISKVYAIRLWVSAGDLLMPNEGKRSDLDEATSIRDHILALDPNAGLANLYAALLERYHLHDLDAAKKHLLNAKAHEFLDQVKQIRIS